MDPVSNEDGRSYTRTVVYRGPRDLGVEEIDDLELEGPDDVVLDITTTAICGSDFHMYEGWTTIDEGRSFDHETMGTFEKVGDGVENFEVGDRMVLPFDVSCGHCENGDTSACLDVESETPGGAYGYARMGPYRGGQAETIRVAYAEFNALTLPDGAEGAARAVLAIVLRPTSPDRPLLVSLCAITRQVTYTPVPTTVHGT